MVFMLVACGEEHDFTNALKHAQCLVNENPEQAQAILDSLRPQLSAQSELWQKRYELEYARTKNKLQPTFCEVEQMKELYSYMEKRGTNNEIAHAAYLLGRAYADSDNAPMAIHYYKVAINAIDTLAANCDYPLICRIYSQMSIVYYHQNLLKEEIESIEKSIKYGWLSKDTVDALMSEGLKLGYFDRRHKPDSILSLAQQIAQSYKKMGNEHAAAQKSGMCFHALVLLHRYNEAKIHKNIYEAHSGFFDEYGNIENGREAYYGIVGDYYYGIGKLDSALFYYKKELKHGRDINNQNMASRRLAHLFVHLNKTDSAAKYALYAYQMNDSVWAKMKTNEVKRIQSMYDYTHFQDIAHQEELKKKNAFILMYCISFFVLFAAIFTTYYLKKVKKEKEMQFKTSQEFIKKARKDIEILKAHEVEYKDIIEQKEAIIREQMERIDQIAFIPEGELKKKKKEIMDTEEYTALERKAAHGAKLSENELEYAFQLVRTYLPIFHEFLVFQANEMSDIEKKTTILIRLYFKPKDVSNLLGVSPSYISKIRVELMAKLFGKNGNSKDFDNKLLQMI